MGAILVDGESNDDLKWVMGASSRLSTLARLPKVEKIAFIAGG